MNAILKQSAALISEFKAIRPKIVSAGKDYERIVTRNSNQLNQRGRLIEEISRLESREDVTASLARQLVIKKEHLSLLDRQFEARSQKSDYDDYSNLAKLLQEFSILYAAAMQPYRDDIKERITSAMAPFFHQPPEPEVLQPQPDILNDFANHVTQYAWGVQSSNWVAQASHALDFIDKVLQGKSLFTWEK